MYYEQFLESKRFEFQARGIIVERSQIHNGLSEFQKDLTLWALKKGRSAKFAATGLGKTRMQAEWGRHVCNETKGSALILAPLAVASQTVREGLRIDLDINLCSQQSDVRSGLNITNYDKLHKFNPDTFDAVILDESSILKSVDGKIRTELIDAFRNTPFKLACTATPAPNDYMEFGNHAEFLGVMSRAEMLSMFFVHDGGETQKWRLKGHAEQKFWEWLSTWAVVIRRPSDLGYEDGEYRLPPLNIIDHVVKVDKPLDGVLVREEAKTLQERIQARRDSINERVSEAARIANSSDKPFIIWCGLNETSRLVTQAVPDAVEITGSDSEEHKERAMLDFADGKIRVLVTKGKIAGFGMNWQHCSEEIVLDVDDSFETLYQMIRRCYRYGQKNPVNVRMIVSDLEGVVSENVKRKEREFEYMQEQMVKYTRNILLSEVRATAVDKTDYEARTIMKVPSWLRSEAG